MAMTRLQSRRMGASPIETHCDKESVADSSSASDMSVSLNGTATDAYPMLRMMSNACPGVPSGSCHS